MPPTSPDATRLPEEILSTSGCLSIRPGGHTLTGGNPICHFGQADKTCPASHHLLLSNIYPTECNYDIYEQELLAVIQSIVHWRCYLGWTKEPFTILTDHKKLQYWKSPQKLNRRMARWHADLQEYDYEIQYIPGKTNIPADALSRPPGVDQGKEDNQDVTLIPPERFLIATIREAEPTSCSMYPPH